MQQRKEAARAFGGRRFRVSLFAKGRQQRKETLNGKQFEFQMRKLPSCGGSRIPFSGKPVAFKGDVV
ncbi:hypothetical protein CB1_002337020 [Camelus ferus]|nr:hypothetical protein CB1_002337020 [Camelus ferus]